MIDAARLLDHPAVGGSVFNPRSTSVPPTLWVEAGGSRLGCHVRRAHPDAGWVIYFHGNGELAADCDRSLGRLFDEVGVNVCFAEYRGYGASPGEPALAGMLGDGERIVAAIGVPAGRVVSFGRSLGSLYAIELARRLPGLAGLVIESGIAAVADLWPLDREAEAAGSGPGTAATALATHFDHRAKLGGYAGPLLILHAAGDELLDRSHPERLHAWGGGVDKRLVVFPHGNHNTILPANFVAYLAELQAFFHAVGLTAPGRSGIAETARCGKRLVRRLFGFGGNSWSGRTPWGRR